MQKLVFINGSGNEIDLTSGNFGITNWEGLSNVPLNIQTQQVPFQDGGVLLDALMDQREIAVTVAIYDGNNLELRYQKKRELISALNPKLGEGTLIYTNDYLSRQIKAVPQIPLFENKNSNDAGTLKASVVFSCPNPYWEDLEDTVVNFSIGEFSTIRNEGDVPTDVEIEITGTVAQPQITNETTGKKIKLTDVVDMPTIINTNSGKKSVKARYVDFKLKEIGAEIKDIAYAEDKNIICAVSSFGNIIYSKDGGEHWNITACNTYDNRFYQSGFRCILYAEERFIASGENGFTAESTDGINWEVNSRAPHATINAIAYSYGQVSHTITYCAVGDNGRVWTFTDSHQNSWSGKTSGVSANLRDVYVSGVHGEDIVAVGENGTLIKSTDSGATFTTISTGVTENLNKLILGGNYIIGDNGIALYNQNYDTNPIVVLPTGVTDNLYDVITNYIDDNGEFYIVLGSNGAIYKTNFERSSFIFERYEVEGIISEDIYCGCYIPNYNTMIFCTSSGIFNSYDAFHFNKKVDMFEKDLNALHFKEAGDYYFLFGLSGKLLKSADLEQWEQVDTGVTDDFNDIAYGNGIYVLVGSNYLILTSEDLVTWTVRQREVGGYNQVNSVAFSPKINKFCALGVFSDYFYLISENGIEWTSTPQPTAPYLYMITYYDDLDVFIAGGNHHIKKSEDLVTWEDVEASGFGGEGTYLQKLAYIKDTKSVVALYYDSRVSYGYVGIIKENSFMFVEAFAGNPSDIAYSKDLGLYVIVCADGTIDETTDCIGSYALMNVTNSSLIGITYSDVTKKFTIFGYEGLVLESSEEKFIDLISKLSNDSDMDFDLQVGDNNLVLSRGSQNVQYSELSLIHYNVSLKYRQKYIGV